MNAVAGRTVTLSDGGGAGTITTPTLLLFGTGITNNATPHITNLVLGSSGDFDFGDVTVSGFLSLSTNGNLSAGNLTAGTVLTVTSGGGLSVHNATASTANFAAGGTANFLGTVRAPTISVTSADINVTNGASLGVDGVTNLLTLNAVSSTPIYIGANPSVPAGSYVLDENGDIRGASVIINAAFPQTTPTATQASGPEVIIGNTRIEGSQIPGGGIAHAAVNTNGTIRVEGAVDFVNAAPTDTLLLSGGQRIEVITPSGGIRMINGTALTGTLTLKSDNIVVTDNSLASQLAADPNFSGHAQALATNTGPVNTLGYLRAGGIQLLAGSNIFIQNTGTATDFGGLTVGGGGLLVGRYQAVTTSTGPGFSFVGTLTSANNVLQFDFTVTTQSQITLRTYSYAGGTNAQGQVIPSGGFDPILALFNSVGALINQNDDGGSNVPADPIPARTSIPS